MSEKIKKSKHVHLGQRVFYDEKGQMFKEVGNSRVYLNGVTAQKIESRKKKEPGE